MTLTESERHPVLNRQVISLVTHNQILISSSVERVWPYIVDINGWKLGPKLRRIAGKRDSVGEMFVAVNSNEDAKPLFYAENMELVAKSLRTIKLLSAADAALIGFSSWRLSVMGSETSVEYHVYSEQPIQIDGWCEMSWQQKKAISEKFTQENGERFQNELTNLKKLVESE